MRHAFTLTTGPTEEPITLDEAKAHLRVTDDSEDAVIDRMIRGSRAQVETYLQRGLLAQTWTYQQDGWADAIVLPRAPLSAVSTVQYYDAAGDLQTLATSVYLVDTMSEPGRVLLAPNQVWPVLQACRSLAVQVVYTVGYASVDDIPPAIVDALYLLVGDRFEHREDTLSDARTAMSLPWGVEALLAPHRVWWSPPVGC